MWEEKQFTVDQRLLTIRNTYVIKDRLGQQLGLVKQEFLSWGPHFWFEDNVGSRLGEVNGKVVTVHHEYEVKDENGQSVARIKKKILKLFGSEWWLEDHEGHEIARIKGNIVHHTYDIVSSDKTTIAKVHRGWATVSDEYCVEIVKQDFSPLLVLAFAIAMDNVEHPQTSTAARNIGIIGKLLIR